MCPYRRCTREHKHKTITSVGGAQEAIHGLELKPEWFMCDFEYVMIKSIKIHFNGIIVKGCLFHISQALYRNLVAHGLKKAYQEVKSLQVWFKSAFTEM